MRHSALSFTVAIVLVLTGCISGPGDDTGSGADDTGEDPTDGAGPSDPAAGSGNGDDTPSGRGALMFDTLDRGQSSGYPDATQLLITDDDTWASVWNQTHMYQMPTPDRPAVDFETHAVIAVFMGEQSTTGHRIEVSRVIEGDDRLQVNVDRFSPGPDCMTGDAMTQPFHMVRIPKTSTEPTFEVHTQIEDC